MENSSPEQITKELIRAITEERKAQGLTYEQLADRAGIHRTTIALWERQERTPTVQLALQWAGALNVSLSLLLARAEAAIQTGRSVVSLTHRRLLTKLFRNEAKLRELTGLTHQSIRGAIEDCHQTLDLIDSELAKRESPPISELVELANLTSMIGNLLAAGLVEHSNGAYSRNVPHTFPDLLPQRKHLSGIEVKTAFERNKPKGHLPKPGLHLTFRYVLCDREGCFKRGKKNRGKTAQIGEVKIGILKESDYDLSNTEGDSGKTAVIRTAVLQAMTLIYFDPRLLPYATRAGDTPYRGFN
ncbi:MAG: helix-turn-helix domain-containing protein [Limisphaerales bacterium]